MEYSTELKAAVEKFISLQQQHIAAKQEAARLEQKMRDAGRDVLGYFRSADPMRIKLSDSQILAIPGGWWDYPEGKEPMPEVEDLLTFEGLQQEYDQMRAESERKYPTHAAPEQD